MHDPKQTDPPPYRALMTFLTAARSGQMSKAAQRFSISPSAVSHQIRTLEDWIGAPLFKTAGRRADLTPIGKVLLDGGIGAADQLDGVAHAVRRSAQPGRITISAPPAFASFRLVAAIAECRRAMPGIDLDLRLSPFDAPVEDDAVDIAIRFLEGEPAGNRLSRRLGVEGWAAVCGPALFQQLNEPKSIDDIEAATFLHEDVFNFWPGSFAALGKPVPAGAVFVPLGDALSVLSAVLAGGGIGLLPREVTRDLWRRGALVRIYGADVEPDAAYRAFVPQGGAAKPDTMRVLDHIAAHLEHG
ncbi:MAG: LysR substrate-binding domain-containing protein [Pseudomonadota bacterium]